MNQPSDEALRKMIRFLLKTSVPRIISQKAIEMEINNTKRVGVPK